MNKQVIEIRKYGVNSKKPEAYAGYWWAEDLRIDEEKYKSYTKQTRQEIFNGLFGVRYLTKESIDSIFDYAESNGIKSVIVDAIIK